MLCFLWYFKVEFKTNCIRNQTVIALHLHINIIVVRLVGLYLYVIAKFIIN